jgi:hypothetical protein
MQPRAFAKRNRKCHERPKERNDTGENPHRNGLFGADPEICGLEGLDDRFHETGLDEASIHGTGIMFVDSSFGKS